uniref:Probable WRKY transcription factor 4 n=2 Tax=Cicer arietinum TaxID=3827 RepID=A0A3Q7XLE1_CICAR|nr:probable WRKY transcription factor 4 [Cicer arietinum]
MHRKRLTIDNKFPKTYYTCINPDCSVKKRVYRNSQEEINVEYNQENHNHQPPDPNPTITELLDTRTGEVIYKDIQGHKWTCHRRNCNINGTGLSRAYYNCIYPNCDVKKFVVGDKITINGPHNHRPLNLNIQENILSESTEPKLQNLVEINSGADVGPQPKRMRSTQITTSEPCPYLKDIEENLARSPKVVNEVKLSEYIAEFQKLL